MIFRHLLNMRSHPTWVRGLKHVMTHNVVMVIMSHPTWVRGLKLYATTQEADQRDVAPYVGAWIETHYRYCKKCGCKSHPTWVRGLKQSIGRHYRVCRSSHPTWVRGLKRYHRKAYKRVPLSHPTWVRGLKHSRTTNHCL